MTAAAAISNVGTDRAELLRKAAALAKLAAESYHSADRARALGDYPGAATASQEASAAVLILYQVMGRLADTRYRLRIYHHRDAKQRDTWLARIAGWCNEAASIIEDHSTGARPARALGKVPELTTDAERYAAFMFASVTGKTSLLRAWG